MSLSYDEIPEKRKKYDFLKKKYLELHKRNYEFKEKFDNIKCMIDSKDLRILTELEAKINELEEEIIHQHIEKKSEHLEKKLQEITHLNQFIEITNLKHKLEKIKRKNLVDELKDITEEINNELVFAKKYVDYQTKISKFASNNKDIKKILESELNKILHQKHKDFERIDRLIKQFEMILKQYGELENKINYISQKTSFKHKKILEELNQNYKQSIQTIQWDVFDKIKNKLIFIDKNHININKKFKQIVDLHIFFKNEENIQEIQNTKECFLSDWNKETFETMELMIEKLENKKNGHLSLCSEIHNKIRFLREETNLSFQQELKSLKQIREQYTPTLLQSVEKQIQQKKDYWNKKQEMVEIKQQLLGKKKKLVDKTVNENISKKAITLAMENINDRLKKTDEELNEIKKHLDNNA